MNLFVAFLLILGWCSMSTTGQKTNQRAIIADIEGLGQVKGKILETAWSGRRFFQFVDVKYGESPSGEMRFKSAQPVKPWNGVRNAFGKGHGCPSLQEIDRITKQEGSHDVEDCLSLTINTKNLTKKYPVMVYIHGEFLYEGSPNEAAPEYLLEKQIVLVAVHYRLAPFGFLSTLSEDIPGNAGVTDVILALQWIQNYIQYFGGDPQRVTIFGQVAGAAIANLLTISPIVPDGLFHQVIYMSGTAQTPAFISESPVKFSRDIAQHANCKKTETVKDINACFLQLNASSLLNAFSQHGIENSEGGIGNYGGVQFTVGGPSGVLPQHPGILLRQKKIRYYPSIGGSVKNAGSYILKEIFEDNFKDTIPDDRFNGTTYIEYIIKQTNGPDPTGAWKSFAESDFFTEKHIKSGNFQTMVPGLIDLAGAIPFKNPILLTLQANAEVLPNATYLYSFNYEGQFNRYVTEDQIAESNLPFELGVTLTDDNIYLFPWPEYASFLSSRDTRIAKLMVALWTSFAANGVPKGPGLRNWPTLKFNGTGPYLRIDSTLSIGKDYTFEYTATSKDEKNGFSLVLEGHVPIDDYNEDEEEEGKPQSEEDDQYDDSFDQN